MAEGQQNSKKGKPSKAGKRKGKFSLYFANTAAKKLRNILKHNGKNALKAYKDWKFETDFRNKKQSLELPKG